MAIYRHRVIVKNILYFFGSIKLFLIFSFSHIYIYIYIYFFLQCSLSTHTNWL